MAGLVVSALIGRRRVHRVPLAVIDGRAQDEVLLPFPFDLGQQRFLIRAREL